MPDLTKEQLYIILAIIAIVLLGCVVGVYNQKACAKQSSPDSSLNINLPEISVKKEADQPIYVHISGSVAREGLYKLNKSDRLIDLLKLSGVGRDADLDSVNLAEVLADSQRIFIPRKAVDAAIAGQLKPRSARSGKTVNINRADEKEFDTLPGIGATMAKRIVEYRKEKGTFSSIEELKEVQGISEKKFEKIKEKISVN